MGSSIYNALPTASRCVTTGRARRRCILALQRASNNLPTTTCQYSRSECFPERPVLLAAIAVAKLALMLATRHGYAMDSAIREVAPAFETAFLSRALQFRSTRCLSCFCKTGKFRLLSPPAEEPNDLTCERVFRQLLIAIEFSGLRNVKSHPARSLTLVILLTRSSRRIFAMRPQRAAGLHPLATTGCHPGRCACSHGL